MRVCLFIIVVLLTGCVHTQLMQDTHFQSIAVGSPIDIIKEKYGSPYEVLTLKDGTQEYHYITRTPCGKERVEQTDYYLRVRKGIVVSKSSGQSSNTSIFQFSN